MQIHNYLKLSSLQVSSFLPHPGSINIEMPNGMVNNIFIKQIMTSLSSRYASNISPLFITVGNEEIRIYK